MTGQLPQGYNELKEGVVRTHWPHVSAYKLSGTDRVTWLQGQVTNDLRKLSTDGAIECCLVKPTGQFLSEFTVFDSGSELVVLAEPGEVFESRVADFVILEDVRLAKVSTGVWSLHGPMIAPEFANRGVPFCRAGEAGFAMTQPPDPDLPEAEEAAWMTISLENRMPVPAWDANERSLPPELGPEFDLSHVSYDKGCYVGQEVLQRIHSRGHVNKVWKVLACPGQVLVGSGVLSEDGAKVGTVHRTSWSPRDGWLAAAFLRGSGTVTVAGSTCQVL